MKYPLDIEWDTVDPENPKTWTEAGREPTNRFMA